MAWFRAAALVLNAAVFAVGVARSRGYMTPADYVYVALVLVAPVVSALGLVLGIRSTLREEPAATVRAAAYILNALLLAFVAYLITELPARAREQQALWIAILTIGPVVNAIAITVCRKREP